MPYHVMIWPGTAREQVGGELYAFDLSEDELRQRFVDKYNAGTPITAGGRTATDISSIQIGFTDQEVTDPRRSADRYEVFKRTTDVTDEWITGPQGGVSGAALGEVGETTQPLDPRRVMVVHGRNESARVAMFNFLRALGLQPIEWEGAIRETGMASPHNLEAVQAAMNVAQAVVVVLTAEDQAGLLPGLAPEPTDPDIALKGQPRQNVVLEAGLAMGVGRERTILVEIGAIRRASDFEGLNAVRMSNAAAKRTALRSRLEGAGCDIDEPGADWLSPDAGGDFEACIEDWEATNPAYLEIERSKARQERARPAPQNVSRAEYMQARSAELRNKLYVFLDRRRGVDQPFSELDLVSHMGDRKFDEVAASRLLRQLHTDSVVFPNPDGSGWYPTDDLGGMQKES